MFIFQLFSHKVIRWFSLLIMLILMASNLLLVVITQHPFYLITFAGQLLMITMALYGAYLDKQGKPLPKLIYLPYYYFLVHLAAILGIFDESRGKRYTVWEHVREA